MAETPSAAGMRAWRTFLEAHARVTARLGDELERETGLPLTWYDVLVHLIEAPAGRLRMSELAEAVLLSKSGLTRLVDRMCGAGLVSRCPDPGDRRGTFVELCEAGRNRLRAASPVHLRGIQEHFARYYTERDANTLGTLLARLGD